MFVKTSLWKRFLEKSSAFKGHLIIGLLPVLLKSIQFLSFFNLRDIKNLSTDETLIRHSDSIEAVFSSFLGTN